MDDLIEDSVLDCNLDGISTRVTGDVVIRLTIPVEHMPKLTPLLGKVGHSLKVAFIDDTIENTGNTDINPDRPEHEKQQLQAFKDKYGQEAKDKYGQQAKALRQSSFLRRPEVWEKVGTDADYIKWVQTQPSCVSRTFSEYLPSGEGRSIAHHVRRSGASGTGFKAKYCCVPLTQEEHTILHAKGEGDFLLGCGISLDDCTGKEWFDRQRIKHCEEWAWRTLKATLGYEHFTELPPSRLYVWAREHGVDQYLPAAYR